MRILLFLLGISILNIAPLAARQWRSRYGGTTGKCDEKCWQNVENIIDGIAGFSGEFVKNIAKTTNKNLVVSPYGTGSVLSMIAFGAQNQSYNQLRRALRFDGMFKNDLLAMNLITNDLTRYGKEQLGVANGAFFSPDIKIDQLFYATCAFVFGALTENVDFSNSIEASRRINEWSDEKTHGLIKKIVEDDAFDEDTAMVLANALYFKGTWLYRFAPATTQLFTSIGGDKIEMPMMAMEARIRYGILPEMDARFVELPYVTANIPNDYMKHNMSMFIILPNEGNSLQKIDNNLHKISVEELIQRGNPEDVEVELPKFKIESEFDLEQPLRQMGINDMFTPGLADLSKMVEGGSPQGGLFVSKFSQKATIEVSEEGSVAAGVTIATIDFRMGDGPYIFYVNRPFYAIIATTGTIRLNLFTVRFTGLKNE